MVPSIVEGDIAPNNERHQGSRGTRCLGLWYHARGESMRTFLSIPLPQPVRASLAPIAERLRQETRMRASWVPAENYHITLQFLGEIEPMLTVALDRVVRSVAQRVAPFQCTLDRLGAFPSIDRARVVWVGGVVPDGFRQLAEGLRDGLADLGFARVRRQTVTHATLARVKGSPDPALAKRIESMNPLSPLWFTVDRVALMESVLTSRGAEHTPLFTCMLSEDR